MFWFVLVLVLDFFLTITGPSIDLFLHFFTGKNKRRLLYIAINLDNTIKFTDVTFFVHFH